MERMIAENPKISYGVRWSRPVPRSVSLQLAAVGGLNRYDEPNYRVLWGGDRHAWIGGTFKGERDRNGNLLPAFTALIREPKHWPLIEHWLLEVWRPAEFYGDRAFWDENSLGPFPERGDYELVRPLPPVEFSPYAAGQLVRLVERSRDVDPWTRKNRIHAREVEAPDREWDRWADDVIDDAIPAFSGFAHAAVPRTYKKGNH